MSGAARRIGPLWRRAPLVLLRFRGLFLAVAAGALLLAAAAASGPLFVSSVTVSALAEELDRYTPSGVGVSVIETSIPLRIPGGGAGVQERIARSNGALASALAAIPELGEPIFTVLGASAGPSATPAPSSALAVRLLARTDAVEHVTQTAGRDGDGLWIADDAARALDLGPGDTLYLRAEPRSSPVSVPVDGVYRALWKQDTTPFWRSLRTYIYPPNPDAGPPPTFLIGDLDQVLELSARLDVRSFEARREWPLEDLRLALAQAERLAERLDRFQRAAQDPSTPLGARLACPACGTGLLSPHLQYSSQLPTAIGTARERAAAVRGPVDLLSLTGALAALAVLAASAAFALAARRGEMALLASRGASARSVGARAALEGVLPALGGALAGLGLALGAVAALGPGEAERPAVERAILVAAVGVPVALAVVGLVTAQRFSRLEPRRGGRSRVLARLPWELVGVALAVYAVLRLRTQGSAAGGGEATRSSMALVAFPVLFVGGGALAASRWVGWMLARLRLRAGPAWVPLFLALRRIVGGGRLAGLLMAATALAVGILVYAQTLVASLDATAEARAALFVGGDVQGYTSPDRRVPADFPFPATIVGKLPEGGRLDEVPVDLLAIEPATFAGPVFWDEEWSDAPLEELLEDLASGGERVPAVVVGPGPRTDTLELAGLTVPLDVVGRATAFPGMRLRGVSVVVDHTALAGFAERAREPDPLRAGGAETQVWASGETEAVLRALERSLLRPFPVVTADEVRENPSIRSVTQTFDFLSALGAAAGLLVLAGALLYLQARRRARVVSYELARRMGLRVWPHRLSVSLELGWMLVGGALLGAVLAVLAARLSIPRLDSPIEIPAGPLLRIPWTLALATIAVLLGASAAAGLLAHRSARRARIAEVLRGGE